MILRASLPVLDGTVAVEGLTAAVSVTADEYGVPTIVAESRLDAFRALGYVTARDRLFQMDLLRRGAAGQLAEVVGRAGVENDIRQRRLGLQQVAQAVAAQLPHEQRQVVDAYTQGVNDFIRQTTTFPFEFMLLSYRPQLWRPEDSVLAMLAMFQALNLYDDDERMRTVMAQTLPPKVLSFLLPDIDLYTDAFLHDTEPDQFQLSIPVEELLAVRQLVGAEPDDHAHVIRQEKPTIGSNGWVLAGSRTADGRAVLANDMHWDMAVPNIWYRARLRYENIDLMGLVIPGIPVVIVGSNSRVAWGFTNIEGDFVDLVRLELNPHDVHQYKTPDGWRRFEERQEVIKVKGAPDEVVDCTDSIWGPVADQPLLGEPVAVSWTGRDPDAVDIGLVQMDRVQTVNEAIGVLNRAKGPANNVLLADADGHIAWTYTGRIPIRRGFDGSISVSWADGEKGWAGYVAAEELPHIIDPPSGFIVSANQRMLEHYPHPIGHAFAGGYRAYRITERLRDMHRAKEADLFQIQLDTRSEFYEFYRRIAREVLTDNAIRNDLSLTPVRHTIDAWNGRADIESVGYGFLIQFRTILIQSVFAPFLARCIEEYRYCAYGVNETSLRALLTAQVPALAPGDDGSHDWQSFLIAALKRNWHELQENYDGPSPDQLTWGQMNRVVIRHPLSGVIPGLSPLLDMPEIESPGCGSCVRVMSKKVAASERLVISPGHPEDALWHMPGGQSGHPLSLHYRDQQQAWSMGKALPFEGSSSRHALTLVPAMPTKSNARLTPTSASMQHNIH
ncbi:MAG: penicillin acylase family protein [Nitrospira sp.]|nr:penicillin acylase family protein [Nitrospira sp.]